MTPIEIATLELVGSRSYPTTLEICRALQKAGFRKQNKQTIKAMIKQKYVYKDKSYLALTIKGKKVIK